MHRIKAGIEQGPFPYYFAVERARLEGGKRSASDKKSIRPKEHRIALPIYGTTDIALPNAIATSSSAGRARSIRRDGSPIG